MKEEIIYEIKVGSHLYGLNTPESDEDFAGIILPTPSQILGTHPIEEIDCSTKKSKEQRQNNKDDVDKKYYTLQKFLHLVSQNNPNIVEFLFASDENILIDSDIMKYLRANADKFISTRVFHSFTGYAFAQKKKLETKRERFLNLKKGIKLIEDCGWDQTDKTVIVDVVTAELLNNTMKYYKGSKNNCNSFEKGQPLKTVYEKLVHEYNSYGWRLRTDTFESLLYDIKFAYHLIRLLDEGRQLLETGRIVFPLTGEAHEDIMRIRNAQVSYEELLTMFDKYNNMCIEANANTTLRKKPDFKWIENFQVETLLKHIKGE